MSQKKAPVDMYKSSSGINSKITQENFRDALLYCRHDNGFFRTQESQKMPRISNRNQQIQIEKKRKEKKKKGGIEKEN